MPPTYITAPTLTQLQEETYRLIQQRYDDTANPNYPLASVTARLNEALYDLVERLDFDWYKSSAAVDAPSGTESSPSLITLPSDYFTHLQVCFYQSSDQRVQITQVTTSYLDEHMPGWRAQTGDQPAYYVLALSVDGSRKIQLVPNLNATVTNGIFYRYTSAPAVMSSGSDYATALGFFPVQRLTVLPYYAAYRLCFYGGTVDEDEKAQKFFQLYEAELEKMRVHMRFMAQDKHQLTNLPNSRRL